MASREELLENQRDLYRQMSKAMGKQIADDRYRESQGWMGTALKGTQVGAQLGGPWGALAGAVVGTVLGQGKAIKERMKRGDSAWDAFKAVHFDFSQPFRRDVQTQALQSLPGIAMGAKSGGMFSGSGQAAGQAAQGYSAPALQGAGMGISSGPAGMGMQRGLASSYGSPAAGQSADDLYRYMTMR